MKSAVGSMPLVNRSANYGGIFDLPKLQSDLEHLDQETSHPDFWKDPQAAARVSRKKAAIERDMKRVEDLERQYGDVRALVDLADEGSDASLEEELVAELGKLDAALNRWRVELLLSGEHDSSNAILAIHPGAGGTESQDWAQMLLRMYVRWAERKKFKVETLDLQAGDEAGIKSVTVSVAGPFAYGYLKAEAGDRKSVV